jgi:hypothetical protein
MITVDVPVGTPLEEGRRIGDAALAGGVDIRLTGGVAVALRCPSAGSNKILTRTYADVDLVGRAKQSGRAIELLSSLGYVADESFNAVHGSSRLYFWDTTNQRQVDVFLDEVEMCHRIDLRQRLPTDSPTLHLADLLLMKLQIVETNDKDYLDILALLSDHSFSENDHGINLDYLAKIAADDWGIWRTTTMVMERAGDYATTLEGYDDADRVREQAARYVEALNAASKSYRWKLRAKVGERKRWYELPEESH